MTTSMRSQIARLGGLTTASRHSGHEMTAAANAANATRWEREVDPDGTLPADERLRRADALKKLHFQKLAFRSSQARRKKTQRANGAAAANNVLPIRKARG